MRPTLHKYMLDVAEVVSRRSTCLRLNVGAVIALDGRVIATDYNGSLSGAPHCIDVGCDVVNNSCVRTIHAEVNAICQSAMHGISVRGASMFVTHAPCVNCAKIAVNSGISEILYANTYKTPIDYVSHGILIPILKVS